MTAPKDVTAAIERLREERDDFKDAYVSAINVASESEREVQRLEATVVRLHDESEAWLIVDHLREEVERLRAEREALHSDETHERVGQALFGVAYDDIRRDGHVLEHYKSIAEVQEGRIDAVLCALTADPEADQ